jgi:MFS family permease
MSSNLQFGYATTYLNTADIAFKDYLNQSLAERSIQMTDNVYIWVWSVILNIWFVGAFIGIWFSPLINDRFGRKGMRNV